MFERLKFKKKADAANVPGPKTELATATAPTAWDSGLYFASAPTPGSLSRNSSGGSNSSITAGQLQAAVTTSRNDVFGAGGSGNSSDSSMNNASAYPPRTNPATKPTLGTFTGAVVTVGPTPPLSTAPATTTSYAFGNGGGSVPTSAASSATPSRSSSTSNRGGGGGAGVSTGSFTPLSATPPMTPLLGHEVVVEDTPGFVSSQQQPYRPDSTGVSGMMYGGISNGEYLNHPSSSPSSSTSSFLTATTISPRDLRPMHQQHYSTHPQPQPQPQPQPHAHHQQQHVMTPPSTSSTTFSATTMPAVTVAGATPGASMGQHPPSSMLGPGEMVEEGSSPFGMAFVSSPISYQAPSNPFSAFQQQQQQQQQHHPVHADTARDALFQQQQYQRQQMVQFREEMDGNSSSSSDNPTFISAASVAAALSASVVPPTYPPASPMPGKAGHSYQQHESSASSTQSALSPLLPSSNNGYSRTSLDIAHQGSANVNGAPVSNSSGTITPGASRGPPGHSITSISGVSGIGSGFFPSPITRAGTSLAASHLIMHDVRQTSEQSHIVDGSGPVVLMAIGKTGQGKSSLLNKILGSSELKASASVRAVTKGIAERSGWGRFEDSRRVLVTVADTPGLADTEGDDEKNIPILKEYIRSVGTRLGVSAFLLVFKIDSGVDMILTILTTFNEIMKEFPKFWDNVVLVFTGCDYRRNVMNTKQLYHEEIQAQLQQHFFKDLNNNGGMSAAGGGGADEPGSIGSTASITEESGSPVVPMVFLSCAESPCGFALGEKCDCKARTTFLNAGLKRLWYAVKNKKRWVLDQDEDDELSGHT